MQYFKAKSNNKDSSKKIIINSGVYYQEVNRFYRKVSNYRLLEHYFRNKNDDGYKIDIPTKHIKNNKYFNSNRKSQSNSNSVFSILNYQKKKYLKTKRISQMKSQKMLSLEKITNYYGAKFKFLKFQ